MLLSRLPYGKQTPMMTVMLDPAAAARRGFNFTAMRRAGRPATLIMGPVDPHQPAARTPPSLTA
ncbi:hypothetical protein [Streptomyces paradoxus]|uniref:hypothetical protein n=1 Tax=Streptomyces paradoxus TaxID=66375 RepID=UPI0037D16CD6